MLAKALPAKSPDIDPFLTLFLVAGWTCGRVKIAHLSQGQTGYFDRQR
jgi:hypothetical protein